MELPRRSPEDRFLPDRTLSRTIERLAARTDAHDLRIVIANAFDFRTRMLPYYYADKRMAPCSARTLADVLWAAGFRHLRVVLQQWTPNFRPSRAVLDGRPVDMLLISSMQVHADAAYELIRDAHAAGEARPLILMGGPKAIYEPTDCLDVGPRPGVGADCAVTGEAFVLLDLLETILDARRGGESRRAAFHRARRSGDLNRVPGLVYLHPDADPGRPVAVNTGVQRLLRDLDELPIPDAGYRLLEPPHRGRELRPRPLAAEKVGRHSRISSLLVTQGCKFNCSFCPIPAVNQRTHRHKSPERLAAEIRHIHENFGIRHFFGTDDNFFNHRATVQRIMTELAAARTGDGRPLSRHIAFYTEATEFDVYRNRDLLPLCRRAGMKAIWFGIEDMTARLVNKGQSVDKTAELFAILRKVKIAPMTMMIHSDAQPLRSRGDMAGLLNQARYLFDIGAVTYQCTYLGPAVGTRDYEPAARSGAIYGRVGGRAIPQAFTDGNHVVASRHPRPWARQVNLVRAYAAFYNPLNILRILRDWKRDPLSLKRLLFQAVGHVGLVMTAPKLLWWAWRLWRGPIERIRGLGPARIPMIDPRTGDEIHWAVQYAPSPDLPGPAPPPCAAQDSSPPVGLPLLARAFLPESAAAVR